MLTSSFFGLSFYKLHTFLKLLWSATSPLIFFSEIVSYICDIVRLLWYILQSILGLPQLPPWLFSLCACTDFALCSMKFSDVWQMCHIGWRIVSPSSLFPVSPVNPPSHSTEHLTMTDIFIVCINFAFSRMSYHRNHWSFSLILHSALCI